MWADIRFNDSNRMHLIITCGLVCGWQASHMDCKGKCISNEVGSFFTEPVGKKYSENKFWGKD